MITKEDDKVSVEQIWEAEAELCKTGDPYEMLYLQKRVKDLRQQYDDQKYAKWKLEHPIEQMDRKFWETWDKLAVPVSRVPTQSCSMSIMDFGDPSGVWDIKGNKYDSIDELIKAQEDGR